MTVCDGAAKQIILNRGRLINVLIATVEIERGTEITPLNASFKRIATRKSYRNPKLEKRIKATQKLKKNDIIKSTNTTPMPDITKGEVITISLGGNNFKIKRTVQALESGFIGEIIKIFDSKERRGLIISKNSGISVKILK